MVSRFTLIFWRWVVTFHDRLHTERDALWEDYDAEAEREAALIAKYPTGPFTVKGANITYTSPSVQSEKGYRMLGDSKDD